MLNDDRDDRPEGDESEYHFSDEEVNYEVEADSPKQAAGSTGSSAKDLLNRVTRSKRMMISIGVFVVLVFVVYRMVAPTTPPSTAIMPAPMTAQQAPAMTGAQQATAPINPINQAQQAAPVNQVNAVNTMPQLTQAPAPAVMQQPVATQPQMTDASAQLIPQPQQQQPAPQLQQQAEQQQVTAATQASPVMSTPAMQANMPASNVPPSAVMAQQQPPQPAPPVVTAQQQPQSLPTQVQLPAVMPVESAAAVTSQSTLVSPAPTNADTSVTVVQNDGAINQLQAEYQQKLNEYASQNKALQDQLQTLNSRVAGMESQMGQLVQALLHQNAPPPSQTAVIHNAEPAAPQIAASEPRIAFNVQAIIPGRAWLRSDDGETVTVAEGDIIKELGRVTKIDPYDGVVEINTGTKVISLSYGAGG